MKYIALDAETGGIGKDKSLLTLYFGVYGENFELLDELDLLIKPNDGIYTVTAEALDINKINLVEHDKKAVTEKEAGTLLYEFLAKNSPFGEIKLIPVGHRVEFDIDFVVAKLLSKGSWEKFVSYRTQDTSVICQFMKAAKLLPEDLKGSLGSLTEYYGVAHEAKHTAKDDAQATMMVLKNMLRHVATRER
jgi:DNA polymerase III alpha subunit (gram-positive type)